MIQKVRGAFPCPSETPRTNPFLPQKSMLVRVTDVSTSVSAPKLKPRCRIQDEKSPWNRSRFPPDG